MLGLGATAFSHEAWKVWLNNLIDDLTHLNQINMQKKKKIVRQKKMHKQIHFSADSLPATMHERESDCISFYCFKKITWVIQA